MKTNREMTESVLQKASQAAAQQKLVRTRAAGILAGALCMALFLGMVLIPWKTWQPSSATQEQPTAGTDVSIRTGKVYFLSSSASADMLTSLKPDMTYAVNHVIRAFPTETQANEFIREWSLQYAFLTSEGSKETYISKNAAVCSLSAGFTSLILPDHTKILKVDIESTGMLTCHKSTAKFDTDYTIKIGDSKTIIPAGSYRVYLNFSPAAETVALLTRDPETPLSTIRDTFTLTVHYTDGTIETLTMDVYLNDEGQVYTSMHRSNTV